MLSRETLKLSQKTSTILLTILVFVIVVAGLWFLRDLVMIVLTAYLLMLALQKPIKKVAKWTRLPMPAVVVTIYILALVVGVAAVSLILPALITETMNFLKQIDINSLAPGLAKDISNFNYNLTEWSEIFSRFASSFEAIFKLIGGTFNVLFMGVTLFVISIHLSFEHNEFYKKSYWFTRDEEKIVRVQKFFLVMEKELGGWISGQVLLMVIMGLLVGFGLYLIGVPYALPLGILAGVLEIVPNI